MSSESLPSTQPYLLRALHEWCTDNGFTPYLAVKVDGSVQVPPEFVRNGEIVLNVSYDATAKLQLGNEYVEFEARFGGVPRQILVPIHRVMAIYARENGQGMAFTVAEPVLAGSGAAPQAAPAEAEVESIEAAHSDTAAEPPVVKPVPVPRKRAASKTAKAVESPTEPPQPPAPKGPAAKRPALRLVK